MWKLENGNLILTSRLWRRVLIGILGCLVITGCQSPRDRGAVDSTGGRKTEVSAPYFRDATEERGLIFVHEPGDSGSFYFPEVMAGGAALLDFDNDGDLDVYFVNGQTSEVLQGKNRATNRLFRQESDHRFIDVTATSGLDHSEYGMGVAVGDVNNDGLPDLYLSNYGPSRLFLNQGGGRFEDITESAGIQNDRWGASACFLDYDRDGWLDLFVTNYVNYIPSRPCTGRDNRRDYCSPIAFDPTPDLLFRNTTGSDPGRVSFENKSLESGIGLRRGPGLGVLAADFDDDGWQDIYVANDGQPNSLWLNQKDGTFRDDAILLGCAVDLQGRSQAGMGTALADVNLDGLPDIFVTNLDGEANALYVSDRSHLFTESATKFGLGSFSYPFTGFGAVFADLDHDGFEDAVVVNGRVTRSKSEQGDSGSFWDSYAERNHIYRRLGDRFEPLPSPRDPFLTTLRVSRALCAGDIDNDGDIDVIVVNIAAGAQLFVNESPQLGGHLIVRLLEPTLGGRDAYGARVVAIGRERKWVRWVAPGASYLSSHDPRVHFGTGSDTIQRMEVRWPNGDLEVFAVDDASAGSTLVVRHGEGQSL